MKRLLLIEDEEVIVKALTRLLERNHYQVDTANTVEQAIELQPASFDLVLADLRLPGAQGTHVIPEADPVPVVIMTSHASVRSAVEAMRHGAIDYIAKPFDHDELLMVIERALTQNLLQSQNRALRIDVERLCAAEMTIEGTSLEETLTTLAQKRDSDRCLHFHGEKGTDKEGLARALHALSPRRDAPFLIADILRDTSQSDSALLFGHAEHPASDILPSGGYLQAAQHGTLVLRHVEHLALDSQHLLAQTLSAGSLHNVNSGRRLAINVKIITIGEQTIESLIQAGSLSQELGGLFVNDQIEIPALRERPQDIIVLARQRLRYLQKRHALLPMKISVDAEAALLANQWQGNITELASVLTRAAFTSRNATLSVEDLGFNRQTLAARDLSLDEYFRYVVLRNQKDLSETEIATRLGISRKALWERRQKMNMLRDSHNDQQ